MSGSPVPAGPHLVDAMTARLPDLLADIEQLVCCESPSADLDAVARSAEVLAEVGERRLGTEPERIVLDGRTHLRWRFGDRPRVLLLGHHDTVWPVGSLATHPFSVTDGVLRGPGCFDMKAGVAMALHAVASLPDRTGVSVLITGDEEIGAPSSEAMIAAEAAGCAGVLVLEASADGGALKTERKGIGHYRVRTVGRAAHAGLEPERGVNASIELAHQLLAVAELGDAGLGTTVTPTAITSGTTVNTVPAAGEFGIDVRARLSSELHRVGRAIDALAPVLPGAALQVECAASRAPLEATASAGLYARAVAIAADLGLPPLSSAAVGGASDGNITAGAGVPTLDGLGAVGGGAHADHEHLLVDQLPARTALVAALAAELATGSGGAHPA